MTWMQKNPSPAVTCTERHAPQEPRSNRDGIFLCFYNTWTSVILVVEGLLFILYYIHCHITECTWGRHPGHAYSIRFSYDTHYLTRKGWLLGVIKTKSAYWLERGLEYSCEFQIILQRWYKARHEAVQLDLSSTIVYGDDRNNGLSVKLESSECSVPQICSCLLRAACIFDHGYRS